MRDGKRKRSVASLGMWGVLTLVVFAGGSSVMGGQERTYAERLGWPAGTKAVIFHVDDAGMSHDSNMGTRKAIEDGVATSLGHVTVTPYEVIHPSGAPSYSLRVELAGRVVTYSGDTEWTDRLVAAASGADLFICEATSYDKRVPLHLDYATIMEHRSELDCKRIILTHMNADMISRAPELELETAHDGREIDL